MLSSRLRSLSDKIQGAIEATLSVHVLAVLSLENHVNFSGIVTLYLLVFSGVKATEAHRAQHLLLLWTLPLEICLTH